MPALGFSKQFAALVESGEKRQTIRAPRKRPIRVGERVYLYTGMRTKACRKLGEGIVARVERIKINFASIRVGDETLNHVDAFELAREDGFDSPYDLHTWFERTHGLPFSGHLIRWRLLPREEWRKP